MLYLELISNLVMNKLACPLIASGGSYLCLAYNIDVRFYVLDSRNLGVVDIPPPHNCSGKFVLAWRIIFFVCFLTVF
jgi:hypothetical protein